MVSVRRPIDRKRSRAEEVSGHRRSFRRLGSRRNIPNPGDFRRAAPSVAFSAGSRQYAHPINMENSRLKKRVMIFDHPFFPFVHSPAAHRRYPSFPVPQEKTPAGISRIMPLYNSVGRIIHHFWLQKNDNVHILRLTQIKKSAVRSEIPQRTKNVFSVQLVASASTQRTVI